MKVTVAICTWNRAGLLEQTLRGMRSLRLPEGVSWELLVVNNNCTDDTDLVISQHEGELPIRRLFEPTPGHSHARNCAVAAATGELFLWTDDDVLVDREWLAEFVQASEQWNDASFFGGTVDPWFAVAPPTWLHRHLEHLKAYVITQQGDTVRALQPSDAIAGASMAFRTDVLKRYPFNTNLGRVQQDLVGADDTDLIRRIRADGMWGVWVGTARVKHYIPADRLTLDYIRRWYVGAGRTQFRLEGAQAGAQIFGAPRWAVVEYAQEAIKAWCYTPFKGPRWLRSFRKSAILRGMIIEARSRSSTE